MSPLAAYVLLFVAVGVGFIFVHLVAGKLIRPAKPSVEKGTIYECGEPTIGSAWVQFDLRFYVVALLFVIFDVEVAFFFPWAEVFGKANTIAAEDTSKEERARLAKEMAATSGSSTLDKQIAKYEELLSRLNAGERLTEADVLREMRTVIPGFTLVGRGSVQERLKDRLDSAKAQLAGTDPTAKQREWGTKVGWLALIEIGIFFGVLLVGFAYLWRRGDLQWVRSTLAEQRPKATGPPVVVEKRELAGAGS